MKSEIRNLKPERNPKSEIRGVSTQLVRNSGFGFLSDFGIRISDFDFSLNK